MEPEAKKFKQTATEAFISDLMRDANEAVLHAKHSTPMLSVLYFAITMQRYDLLVLQQFRPSH